MATGSSKVKAFTIMEAIVVIAIFSILFTIVVFSINRFQLSLKINQNLMEEITQFETFRATLWEQSYFSDSIHVDEENLKIYKNNKVIHYQMVDGSWHQKVNQNYIPLNLDAERITTSKNGATTWIQLPVILGENEIEISFPNQVVHANLINDYFKSIDNE